MEDLRGIAGRYRGRIVVIQAPEGLKVRALDMARDLRAAGVDVILVGDPCYGSCMLADQQAAALGAAALIHLGHAPIPGIRTALPVHFIEERDEPDPGAGIEAAADILISPVGLVTTVQHIGLLPLVRVLLEERGYRVLIGRTSGRAAYDGQVLGCDLSTAHAVEDEVANFLYVGTGRFHPLGVALATGKPVVALDPYRGEVEIVDPEPLLRQRYAVIARAMDARRIGVIVSPGGGQARIGLALDLVAALEEAGREPHLISADLVLPETLEAFRLDAFVVTSCPRIPLDDQARFEVPVLTAGEAQMLLKGANGVLDGEYLVDEFGGD